MKISPKPIFAIAIPLYSFFTLPAKANAYIASGVDLPKAIACDTIPPKDTTGFKRVEKEAYFIGGDKAWMQFISENVNSKVPVKKKAPAGTYTVIIQFIVRTDGSVSDIEPLTNIGYGMEDEVMRVIKKSPQWVPAVQDGKKVNAYRKQPITFRIDETEKKKRSKEE